MKFIGIMGAIIMTVAIAGAGDPVKRNYYEAKFEPETTVLHGGGQSPEAFDLYSKALVKDQKPAIYMYYCGITHDFRRLKKILDDIDCPDLMPQIGLNLKGKDAKKGKSREDLIAEGAYDEKVDAFCLALKALDRPCFVRIGYEFEGRWNGYSPKTYKQCFINITKALRKHKVKAATVWCSAGASAGKTGGSMNKLYHYYPGDEWVDWWGIDLFDRKEMDSKWTKEFLTAANKHKRPVMIGESTPRKVGVLKGQKSWDAWFKPYFNLIRTRPEIKAFCYINWEWKRESERTGHKWHHWGDCRIEENKVVAKNYQKEMSSPLYQHAPTEAAKVESKAN